MDENTLSVLILAVIGILGSLIVTVIIEGKDNKKKKIKALIILLLFVAVLITTFYVIQPKPKIEVVDQDIGSDNEVTFFGTADNLNVLRVIAYVRNDTDPNWLYLKGECPIQSDGEWCIEIENDELQDIKTVYFLLVPERYPALGKVQFKDRKDILDMSLTVHWTLYGISEPYDK